MSKTSSSLVLASLGSAAVGLLIGWQLSPGTAQEVAEVPAAVAAAVHQLQLGDSHRGELTTQSGVNRKDGSRFSEFTVELSDNTLIEIELKGSLHGVVSLFDSRDDLLNMASHLRHRIEQPGQYTLVVSGMDADSYGPFDISIQEVELTDEQQLSVPANVRSWLQEGLPNHYVLQIDEVGFYQIDMRSDDVDSYLVLEGPGGYRNEDDDGGDSLNASIRDLLEPGEYQVTARAYSSGSGFFTLSVENRDHIEQQRQNQAGELQLDQTHQARLERDREDVYQVSLAESGYYQIDMISDDLDPYLELQGQGVAYSDDDGGDGLNARLYTYLEAGEYRVIARGFDENERGAYQITLTQDQ